MTTEETPRSRHPLGMALFLLGDAMGFVALLASFLVLAGNAPEAVSQGGLPFRNTWAPEPPVSIALAGTGLLALCSLGLFLAGRAARRGRRGAAMGRALLAVGAGSAFLLLQVHEWRSLHADGFRLDGLVVPSLEVAMERSPKTPPEHLAETLYGARAVDPEGARPETTADWLARELLVEDAASGDHRPVRPGVLQLPSYGLPPTAERAAIGATELQMRRREAEPEERIGLLRAEREEGARVASPFASAFFVLTGFHGLHVLAGVVMLLLFGLAWLVRRPVGPGGWAAAGLYWHFVDLVWVGLVLLLYV